MEKEDFRTHREAENTMIILNVTIKTFERKYKKAEFQNIMFHSIKKNTFQIIKYKHLRI